MVAEKIIVFNFIYDVQFQMEITKIRFLTHSTIFANNTLHNYEYIVLIERQPAVV